MARGWAAEVFLSTFGRNKPHPARRKTVPRKTRESSLGLFSKGSKVGILLGNGRPRLIQTNGSLQIGASFIQITQLTMVTAELKFDMRIVGKFTFSLQKDRATLLKGVLVADCVCQGDPDFGLFGALAAKLFCRFSKLHKATGGTEDPGAQKIQGEAVIPFPAGLGDAAKRFVVHSQTAVPFQLFLKFSGVVHELS